MSIAGELRTMARFAGTLRKFLREPLTLDQARAEIRQRLEQREEHFLRIVRRGVYDHAKSPYLPLLHAAHCEYGDLERAVRTRGLEAALLNLREEGVYVTFEEFKGREPIIRPGIELHTSDRDFDNPYLEPHYYSETSGSTGAGTRVPHELGHLGVQAVAELITDDAHDVLEGPRAVWRGILPDGSGINTILRSARYSRPFDRWFAQELPHWRTAVSKYTLATYGAITMAKASGVQVPWPERVMLDDAHIVARWMERTLRESGRCLVCTIASRALRVCVAAEREGIDLTGGWFRVGGEPFSPAKHAGVERTGARAYATYGFIELGRVGMGCPRPVEPNDVHLITSMCALVQHTRELPSGVEVPTFLFTLLSPAGPKILLNAECDDFGVVETRQCGCPLGDLGLTTHLRRIKSFRKLTTEGVTVLGSHMEQILEEVLPSRFGGSANDYQLLEDEDANGQTHLELLINPSVRIDDESAVTQMVLQELDKVGTGSRVASTIWAQAHAIRVRRAEPLRTARGKLMSIRTFKRTKT
jgi:hypothetical protein